MDDRSPDSERRHCPRCGEPLAAVVIEEPSVAVGHPCGHQFPLDALND
jgi:uncharacterized protein with PIN domain